MGAEMTRWFATDSTVVMATWRAMAGHARAPGPGAALGRRRSRALAEDVRADGTLVVAGRPFAAGDVIHLRPAG